MNQLDTLEAKSVHILREAYRSLGNVCMLWSIGKDSTVLLRLARKAFFGHVPIPLVHIDTAYKMPEMIEYRDRLALEWHLNLVVGQNRKALEEKATFPDGNCDRIQCCRNLKTMALKHTLDGEWPRLRIDHTLGRLVEDQDLSPYTGVIVGVRADEEGWRSKERYFSPRDVENDWNVDDQPPELWRYFKTDFEPGTHVRVHPLLDWTELNVWEYIERENIPVTSLYFDDGTGTRCRSLGCYPCTTPVQSTATNVAEIIAGAAHRQVQQHRRAQRPRPGQGRRRRPGVAAPRGVHVSLPTEQPDMAAEAQSCPAPAPGAADLALRPRAPGHRRRRPRGPRQEHRHRPPDGRHRLAAGRQARAGQEACAR